MIRVAEQLEASFEQSRLSVINRTVTRTMNVMKYTPVLYFFR